MAKPSRPSDNICLDAHAVQHCVSYSLQQIGRLEASGKFPKRIHLGPNRVGWSFREILDWMQSKVDARQVGPMSPKVIIDTADRFIHTKELRAMVLYSRNHVRNLEASGKFPRHIWLSDTRVVWLEREVKEWLQTQRERGAAAAALKTHHVRLCRPRFEVTNLTVQADSSNSAEQTALTLANTSKTGWRLLPYQPEIYEPHVAICLQSESPKQSTDWQEILGWYHDNNVRYLLLHADTKSSAGRLLLQPWFTDEELGRRARDLANAWVSSIHRRVKPGPHRGGPAKRKKVSRSNRP